VLERIRRAMGPAPAPAERVRSGTSFSDLYPTSPPPLVTARTPSPTGGPRRLPALQSSQLLAAANPSRKQLLIYNDTIGTMFVALASRAALDSYTFRIAPGKTGVLEGPDVYQGDVAVVFDQSASGAYVTEVV
jgi:hypothetical protein